VRRVVIHGGHAGKDKPRVMMFDGKDVDMPDSAELARSVQKAMPFFGLDEAELRAALKEQGIKGAKADAVVARLQEKRAEALRKQFSWAEGQAKFAEAQAKRAAAFAAAPCPPGSGQRVMIDSNNADADGKPRVRMVGCGGAEISKDKQVAAMKKARDRLAAQKDGEGMSAEIRASVVADLDKAIADLDKAIAEAKAEQP
jgi:bla regulator protein blaR1